MTPPTPPALPLSPAERSLIAFCKGFYDNKPGFYAQYERALAEIWHTSRQKRGLKAIAYQQTEDLYDDLFCEGSLFVDRENFIDQYSKFKCSRKPRTQKKRDT